MINLFQQAKASQNKTPSEKGFYVYMGYLKGTDTDELVYIGTTVQKPADRFRWHKANGKDLRFVVVKECKDAEEMLEEEYRLILLHRPRMNKIVRRKQNFNMKLDNDTVKARIGDKRWCQTCLKRHVSPGYTKCRWCS